MKYSNELKIEKKVSKTNKTILNSVSSLIIILLNGLFNILVVRQIIIVYGSEFNGINSTATQFISILLIVEGGFALAANVSLFEPLNSNNTSKINRIMSAIRKKFHNIGIIFLIIGLIVGTGFTFIVKTEMPSYIVFFTFNMLVVSTAFNLIYATTYRVILQSDQKEYVINIINIIGLIFTNIILLYFIRIRVHELTLRFVVMFFALIQSITVGSYAKHKYKYMDYKAEPLFSEIKGTKDVFAQKIVGLLYYSIPILFIATFVGAIYASVYAVYNTVFVLIKGLSSSLINAPRMGMGKLISEKNQEHVFYIFSLYEYISILLIFTLLSTTAVLIMPFIIIYTRGVSDINYLDPLIALFFILTTLIEMIHIPSGNIINMSGNFKVGRNIHYIAGIVLIFGMIIGALVSGIYGILFAILATALVLGFLEIFYVHNIYFNKRWKQFFQTLLSSLLPAVLIVLFLLEKELKITNFLDFLLNGLVVFVITSFSIFIFNLLFNFKMTKNLLILAQGIVRSFIRH